jgi:hypothetical protein
VKLFSGIQFIQFNARRPPFLGRHFCQLSRRPGQVEAQQKVQFTVLATANSALEVW